MAVTRNGCFTSILLKDSNLSFDHDPEYRQQPQRKFLSGSAERPVLLRAILSYALLWQRLA
jgi:hypothetical protein